MRKQTFRQRLAEAWRDQNRRLEAEREIKHRPLEQITRTYRGRRGSADRDFRKDAAKLEREGWVFSNVASRTTGVFGSDEVIGSRPVKRWAERALTGVLRRRFAQPMRIGMRTDRERAAIGADVRRSQDQDSGHPFVAQRPDQTEAPTGPSAPPAASRHLSA